MMKKIFEGRFALSVFHNEEYNYIILKWRSFRISLEEIQEMHRIILDYALGHGCEIYVADSSDTTSVLSEDIIAWWKNEWVGELIKNGIKMIITILPRDILAQQSTFDWQKAGYEKIVMPNVFSLEQAENKIREYHHCIID